MQYELICIPQFFLSLETSEEKSSDDNENDIEINLNINLNGVGEKKTFLGEFLMSIIILLDQIIVLNIEYEYKRLH